MRQSDPRLPSDLLLARAGSARGVLAGQQSLRPHGSRRHRARVDRRHRPHALTLHLPDAYLGTYGSAAPSFLLPAPTRHGATDRAAVASVRSSPVPDPRARGHQAPSLRLGHDDGVPQVFPIQLSPLRSPVNGAALPVWCWSSPSADLDSPVILLLDGQV